MAQQDNSPCPEQHVHRTARCSSRRFTQSDPWHRRAWRHVPASGREQSQPSRWRTPGGWPTPSQARAPRCRARADCPQRQRHRRRAASRLGRCGTRTRAFGCAGIRRKAHGCTAALHRRVRRTQVPLQTRQRLGPARAKPGPAGRKARSAGVVCRSRRDPWPNFGLVSVVVVVVVVRA